MAKKGGENSKKAAGQARKAQAAADKAAAENRKNAEVEDAEWDKGAKNNSRKEAQAAKKAEQAQKKKERETALAEEEENLPSRAGPKKSKTAVKKTKRGGIDRALLETDGNKAPEVSGSGLDNALLILSLDSNTDLKVDRHPERRYKAAFKVFKDKRLEEMKEDGSGAGLRLSQKEKQIKDEFDKSSENPLRNIHIKHNATREEIEALKENEKSKTEALLASK